LLRFSHLYLCLFDIAKLNLVGNRIVHRTIIVACRPGISTKKTLPEARDRSFFSFLANFAEQEKK